MPTSEIEWSVELLSQRERGAVLQCLASHAVNGDAHFLPNYWKREEYRDWLRLYGRTVLRMWYADHDDPKAQLILPDDQEGITIWDYFHQPLKVSPSEPWFVRHWAFNMNHRGILLRLNWNHYAPIFKDLRQPPVGFSSLIPGIKPNTWIVDEIPQEEIPENTQPKIWKEPEI